MSAQNSELEEKILSLASLLGVEYSIVEGKVDLKKTLENVQNHLATRVLDKKKNESLII